MKRTFLIVVGLVALAGAALAAKKPEPAWEKGTLAGGGFDSSSTTVNVGGAPLGSVWDSWIIWGGDYIYTVTYRVGRKRPNVTVMGPIRYRVEKTAFYVKDESNQEFKMQLLEKRLK